MRGQLNQSGSPKPTATPEKSWNPQASLPAPLAQVAESEPNDSPPTEVNYIDCGDTFRPAAIDVPDDIDFIEVQLVAGSLVTFGTNADGAGDVEDTVIGIFDDLGNLLDSDDDGGPNYYSLLVDFPAPYTGTYYLAIIGYDAFITGNYQAFLSCSAPPDPPDNDTCAGAPKLDCKAIDFSGTTDFANNDYTPSATGPDGCTGYTANGADIVYLVTLPDGGSINLTYTSTADGSIYLLDACVSPALGACLAGADDTFTGEPEVLTYTNTSGNGQSLYLILDSYGFGSFGTFNLTGTVSCPPVGVESGSWSRLKVRFGQ